jgi:hypothetical protein
METKMCNTCKIEKEISCFPREHRNDVWYYRPKCKDCVRLAARPSRILWEEENKEKLDTDKREWYQNNREVVKERASEYKKQNRNQYNENARARRKTDSTFQLRENIRSIIRQMIKKNYGSKNGSSISNYLSYTIQELKKHLEKQFEPWMTWQNNGKYDPKTWNNEDQSTWKWQLDHIVPQSDLPYSNMEEDNFKKCWALDNLRPLSAKNNSIDGASRSRHKGK